MNKIKVDLRSEDDRHMERIRKWSLPVVSLLTFLSIVSYDSYWRDSQKRFDETRVEILSTIYDYQNERQSQRTYLNTYMEKYVKSHCGR